MQTRMRKSIYVVACTLAVLVPLAAQKHAYG